jgi:hypothetical protein
MWKEAVVVYLKSLITALVAQPLDKGEGASPPEILDEEQAPPRNVVNSVQK